MNPRHSLQRDSRCNQLLWPSAMTRSSASSLVKYPLLLRLLFLLLCIATSNGVDASCSQVSTLIKCTKSMVSDSQLTEAIGAHDIHVRDYDGQLATRGNAGSEITSIQFYDSTIRQIQPKFFYQFTDGNLNHLILSQVAGNFRLNSDTLGGLEGVLNRLEISDHKLQDMGDIGNFEKLHLLKLVRTGITTMPRGFERIATHLDELDVSHNKLTRLPWETLAKRLETANFRGLRLGNNPWHCDCRMKPILMANASAKVKVAGLKCASPPELANQTFDRLAVEDICTGQQEIEANKASVEGAADKTAKDNKDEAGGVAPSSGGAETSKNTNQDGTNLEAVEVASAGASGLSTEVIAVIVAVCVVVILVISAVIAYKVRKRNARRKSTGGKPAAFQSNSYCAVVESPEEGRVKHPSKPGKHDISEREPLAGTGYNGRYPDPRL